MARGRLRVYLGAAPGVGKTYAMLDEGWRRRSRGTDVVVGYVETHGRAGTARQLRDLPIVPRRTVEYRGATLEEMDLDAVLARQPAVALVDELAHTNAPGSRNAKRWQDIDELLDAGIDVISTVNIQHLESLNDVMERITGVTQRETVPDAVVRAADQIELVDMSPEALRRRMAHGNIYPPERVDAALANYFRPGNLGALRELALLWVADRVEESLQRYLDDHGITEAWETRERVVVAISGAPGSDRLIRRAGRMALRVHGELLGVHVAAADGRAGASEDELHRQRDLVVQLGGSYHEVVGDDVASALASFASAERATQVILGASRRSRWQELLRGSPVTSVLRRVGDIDVHVIAGETEPEARRVAPVARGAERELAAPAAACGGMGARRHRSPAADAGADPAAGRPVAVDGAAALPRRGGPHRRCRRPGRRAGRRGGGLPARELVLHAAAPHVHHRGGGEPGRAVGLRRGLRAGQRAGGAGPAPVAGGAAGPRRGAGAGPHHGHAHRRRRSAARGRGATPQQLRADRRGGRGAVGHG